MELYIEGTFKVKHPKEGNRRYGNHLLNALEDGQIVVIKTNIAHTPRGSKGKLCQPILVNETVVISTDIGRALSRGLCLIPVAYVEEWLDD